MSLTVLGLVAVAFYLGWYLKGKQFPEGSEDLLTILKDLQRRRNAQTAAKQFGSLADSPAFQETPAPEKKES